MRSTLPRWLLMGAALLGLSTVAACGSTGGGGLSAPTETVVPVQITAIPVADTADAPLDQPITITVTSGTISSVAVTSPTGPVAGTVGPEATTWTSSTALTPSTTYQVALTVVDSAAQSSVKSWQFTTAAPDQRFRAVISPVDDAVVGVGMPVVLTLSNPIPAEKRADFIKHLTVTATPVTTGAWHWFSPTELHWRPAQYWAPGTKVNVAAKIAGYDAGGGAWGTKDVTVNYTIGDAHLSTVDTTAHTMTVMSNLVVQKVVPVSTGRDAYPTKSGTHVVSEKLPTTIMDSSTVGIPKDSPDGYYETVQWNVRISNSGEFVHAAPWSTGAQGNSNVSHGCVNVSTPDAEWFFNFSQVGDVVVVNGSSEALEPTNGLGDWQIPWASWAN